MKKILSSVFILCIVISAFAQKSTHPSTLSIVGGVERSVYLCDKSPYFGLDYEYRVLPLPFLKFGMGVGVALGDGGYGEGQTRVEQKIRGISPYARVLVDMLSAESDFDLSLGVGARYFFYNARYTSNIITGPDGVVSIEESSYSFDQMAYASIFQALYHVNSRISVGIVGECNLLVNKEKIEPVTTQVTQVVQGTSLVSSGYSTSYPLQPLHLTVKAGYRF
jgi:hypothetical protein